MYAAAVADMEVDRKTGVIKVPRVVMAADVGLVVNPDGVKNQLEGGIVQAISLTMKEQVSFDFAPRSCRDRPNVSLLHECSTPSARTYASQLGENSGEVTLICKAAS
jgi:nicotinate dehydrogenase subunit B